MSTYYYFLFVIFALVAFLMAIDPNLSRYFVLMYEWLEMNTRKTYYMVKLHPWNFITSGLFDIDHIRWQRNSLTKINSEVRE